MFSKESKVYSMVTGKCPKCHEDDMYMSKNPYNLTTTMKMHENCRNCGLKYKIEPNFFFGAMYISYGLSVLEGLAVFLIAHFVFKAGFLNTFIALLIVLFLSMPVITRYSRNIYINLFVSYNKNAGDIARHSL